MPTGIDFPVQSYGTIASLYLRVVILTMFSYNFILTIEDEIIYIWSKPFSFGAVFYIVGRYLAAVSVLYSSIKSGFSLIVPGFTFTGSCDLPDFGIQINSTAPCRVSVQLQDSGEYYFPFRMMFYTSAIVAVCAMVVLQLRTYALYNKSKKILSLFCILNTVAIVFFVVQLTVFTRLQDDPRLIDSIFGIEFFGSGTNYTPLFWAPFMLNEMTTFSLVVYKFCTIRNDRRTSGMSQKKLSLSNIIVRDNMIYFSVIFFVYLFGLLLLTNEELLFSLANTHLLASVAVSGILAPHLFLSLKKGFYAPGQELHLATNGTAFHATAGSHIESGVSHESI